MKKNILVTGGSGFLGSHLCDELTNLGHNVFIFDKNISPYLQKSQVMINGDFNSLDLLNRYLPKIDTVFHFAAHSNLDESTKSPKKFLYDNIFSTSELLNKINKYKNIKHFIYASTLYVSSEKGSFYRVSKHSSELIIEEYSRAFGLNYSILRFGTVYGTRSNNENSLYRTLYQAYKKNKISIPGSGEEIREFIHVKDAINATIMTMNKKYYNQNLLITGLNRFSLKELSEIIKEIFNNKIKIKFVKARKSHYKFTPFSLNRIKNKKIILDSYYDLSEGIIEIVEEIENSIEK